MRILNFSASRSCPLLGYFQKKRAYFYIHIARVNRPCSGAFDRLFRVKSSFRPFVCLPSRYKGNESRYLMVLYARGALNNGLPLCERKIISAGFMHCNNNACVSCKTRGLLAFPGTPQKFIDS